MAVLLPTALVAMVSVFLFDYCDPKFSCYSTFLLVSSVSLVYAFLAAAGAALAYTFTSYSVDVFVGKTPIYFLIVFGLISSVISGLYGVQLAAIGVMNIAVLWLLFSMCSTKLILFTIKNITSR
ncbi:hypothetical protein [Paraglaciecola aestuariivivens]